MLKNKNVAMITPHISVKKEEYKNKDCESFFSFSSLITSNNLQDTFFKINSNGLLDSAHLLIIEAKSITLRHLDKISVNIPKIIVEMKKEALTATE